MSDIFIDDSTEEDLPEKYIIVVGRSNNGKEFASVISEVLTDNFSIVGVHSLGERSELDKKERYISFISGQDMGSMNADFICSRFLALGFGSRSFDSQDEAFEYAKETYDFGSEDEEKQQRFNELKEKFPPFSAFEQRAYMIFDSLYKLDRTYPIRARLDDEPVTAIISISHGKEDVIITPVAILVDENIESRIELPVM
jgi:hypothetical protein